MKRLMLNTLLLSLTVALWGCGGDSDDAPMPSTPTITVSPESISAPAEGGIFTVSVSTTGAEWGKGEASSFLTVTAQNTASSSGTLAITVPANPETEARTGAVTIMSGILLLPHCGRA